jgi:glucan phosphoethanolaminetransferase (alkaline phosphatase superfamily)
MNNKYRLAFMIVIIIVLFNGIVDMSSETNFAFVFAALILSVSMSIDTFAKENRVTTIIISSLEVVALLIVVMFPIFKDTEFAKKIMKIFNTDVLLLLALFFSFAGQWASEIKWKDEKKRRG